jgi:hypothetical protein
MTSSRKYAEIAAVALGKMLQKGFSSKDAADIVESVLADATREQMEERAPPRGGGRSCGCDSALLGCSMPPRR